MTADLILSTAPALEAHHGQFPWSDLDAFEHQLATPSAHGPYSFWRFAELVLERGNTADAWAIYLPRLSELGRELLLNDTARWCSTYIDCEGER